MKLEMKTTLPTLNEIIELSKTYLGNSHELLQWIYKWFDFFNLMLELWMFIPCNDEGEPLEEPNINHYKIDDILGMYGKDRYAEAVEEYQKAKDRVLFKGFKMIIGPVVASITNINVVVGYIAHEGEPFRPKYSKLYQLCNKVELVKWKYKKLGL